jgi:hypothetical protein
MLRTRATQNEERKRLPRWLVWLPLGMLGLLLVVAVVPFVHEIGVPVGPGHWVCLVAGPQPDNNSYRGGPSIDGDWAWDGYNDTTELRVWHIYLGAGLMYWLREERPRRR